MHKFVGIVCLVCGVLLVVTGRRAAYEWGSQVHYLFTGAIPIRPRYLLIGGGVLCVMGIFNIYRGK